MEIRFDESSDVKRVILTGRFDIEGTGQIEMKLTSFATTFDNARIVFDMAGVEYLASIGLGLIIRTAQAVERRKGKVIILQPQPVVARVLSSSAIDRLVPVIDDESAIAETFASVFPAST